MKNINFKDGVKISFLLISILLHFLFFMGVNYIPLPEKPRKPIEIEIVEQTNYKPQKNLHVVRKQDIPLDQIINSMKKTEFLSEKTVRVKEQLRAQKSGLTQNRSSQNSGKQVKALTNDSSDLNKSDFLNHSRSNISGISTISEDLPDNIKVGDVTALDSDQYLYYSFVSRSGEAFYNEWAPLVQGILERPPVLLRSKGPGRYTTILEVWYLPSGKIFAIHVLKPSGIPELDFAATKSFKTVAMVPNPPKQKIDSDGLIRFTWQLTANFESKALVRQ
jgi:hypothetical protein